MGIFRKAAEAKEAMQTGSTVLTENQILGLDAQSITPTTPGAFGIHRSLGVFQKPGYMTQAQADKLAAQAAEAQIKAKATKQGLKHAATIMNADTEVKIAHDNYLVHQAGATFVQAASNANRGRQIAGLQPRYAGLGQSVTAALGLNQAKVNGIGFGQTSEKAKTYAALF
jgi:hypothetical protein